MLLHMAIQAGSSAPIISALWVLRTSDDNHRAEVRELAQSSSLL